MLTPGFKLPAAWVIHRVGPVYDDAPHRAPELLAGCCEGALAICKARGITSIAFPAISTGVCGYPMDEAALVSLCAIRNHLLDSTTPLQVRVVLFDRSGCSTFVEVGDCKL